MSTLKKVLLAPFTFAGAIVSIAGRITAGIIGFLLMGGGLCLIDLVNLPVAGIPVFIVGFLLAVRAVF